MPPKKKSASPKRKKSAAGSAGKKGKKKGKTPPAPEENLGHPHDIFPLVLTSATQERFGCRADEDVTGKSPLKLLNKDDIIQDLRTRAAVSDFSPVKKIVLDYPDDELLLVFDSDFLYGQCFYLVLTPEAKERISNVLPLPEPETTDLFEDEEIHKTPEPKPWISLGSELEVDEQSVKETREKLHFKFSKVRRKFGLPVSLSDRNTTDAKDGYLECASYQDSKFSITQMQRDCGIQAVARLQSSSAQTQWKLPKNIFTQCTPIELSHEEKEKILQSEDLKNVCNLLTPRFLQALQQERITNVFFDDWEALAKAAEDSDWSRKVSEGLMLYQAFTDLNYTKDKKISSVNWHPTIYGVIAVALIDSNLEKKEEDLKSAPLVFKASLILFYNFSDPSVPQLLLECPDDVFAFDFSPSDPNIIVGGCMNGQVVLWDLSDHVMILQGTQPSKKVPFSTDVYDLEDNKETKTPVVRFCAVSALENSHKAPITDIQWLPPTFEVTKTGSPVENQLNISTQVITCAPDCSLSFWDVRPTKVSASDRKQNVDQKTSYSVPDTFKHLDRTWKPLVKVSLPRIETSGEYAGLKFSMENYTCTTDNAAETTDAANENDDISKVVPDYSQLSMPSAKTLTNLDDVNTKLFVGTEVGEILYTDWKMTKDDSGRPHSAKPLHCFRIHNQPVNTVERSPFFKDIILTIGCWNFAIWREEAMTGPIILSPSSDKVCTVGCWSLSRPAVFFIGKEDGSVDVWNLLEKIIEPVQVNSHATNGKITCIKPWTASSKQHFLAVTDDLGMLCVFEIPKLLYVPSRNEGLNVMKYLMEVEEDRMKDLLKSEELWEKQKQEVEHEVPKRYPKKPWKSPAENENHRKLEESILKDLGMLPTTDDDADTSAK